MTTERPLRILVTNDDGIHAPGLAVLERIAAELSDEVWVCAPTEEQSGAGHSLTLHMPVRLRKHGERRYSVTGTPTDSVTLALRLLFADNRPDLVISGVNAGENLGDDITYSGTISAAMEAALAGIPAVALSQVMRRGGDGFAAARLRGEDNADPMLPAQPGSTDQTPRFAANHAGGIAGGISTGQPVVVRVAFKPTSSILIPQDTVTTAGEATQIVTKGRHDPCVGIRGTPVVAAMMALVLADHCLLHRAQCSQ